MAERAQSSGNLKLCHEDHPVSESSKEASVIRVGAPELWGVEPAHSVSVGELACLVRSGDLTSTDTHRVTAREGIKTHLAVQKRRQPPYIAEQSIRYRRETPIGLLEIRGRMDGFMPASPGLPAWLEEIKTSRKVVVGTDLRGHAQHTEQLHWYAWMVMMVDRSERVVGQLTYVHPDSLQEMPVRIEWTSEDLCHFAESRIRSWIRDQGLVKAWQAARDTSIKQLVYPMAEYRPHQRSLATTTYRALAGVVQQTWIEAPTGLGKTLGVLFPALKVFPERPVEKIFYFSAKVDGQRTAEKTLALIRQSHDLHLASTTITAKRSLCPNPELPCDADVCRYARGYYDRVDEGLAALRLLKREEHVSAAHVRAVSETHELCPFELNLDFARECDVIIADYNYGFDPRVRLRRFFDAKQCNHIFLIDEAHNLLSRSIDMFSETLALNTVISAKASIDAASELHESMNAVIREVKRLLKAQSELMEWIEAPSSLDQLRDLTDACLRTLLISDFPERPPMPLLETWWMLDRFFDRLSEFSEHDRIIIKRQPESQIVIACVEPGDRLQENLQQARSVVAFSATLRPRSWVESRLKVPTSAQWVGFPSPFAPENQFTAIIRDIDVRYQSRTQSLPQLVSIIHTTVTARSGNYLVFCPSYAFLSGLATLFSETHPNVRTVVQQPDDSREDIERFVADFKESIPILGFAVQGGRYAESIDFKGDLLIGAMIIGLGLAPRSALADAISERHPNSRGYDESYRYPALLKTIQTAGRVIRGEQDRGVILLIDHRFERKENRHHLPHWWQFRSLTSTTLALELEAFWRSEPHLG